MEVIQKEFGKLDGRPITAVTMINEHGMEVTSIDYGCIITSIIVPDKNGVKENVVLGFGTIEEYEKHSPYFGAIVGRFAGRIKDASFELDDQMYTLAKNNNGHNLHGGEKGFDKVFWDATIVNGGAESSVVYSYLSPDGEEGFPGNLKVQVTYTLSKNNELSISFEAVTDKKTLVNLTNHTYFNLSGNLKRDILDHELTLKSDSFLELDSDLLPTGKILRAKGTEFDFTEGRKISDGTESKHHQNLLAGNGYDHAFLLNENQNREIILREHKSGRVLTVETDQKAVVLYTGTQLNEDFTIRGIQSKKHLGLCLETQGLPNNIHHPHFPSSILDENQTYRSSTKYRFETEK